VLKIKDSTGQTVAILKDEDTVPELTEVGKKKEEEVKEEEEGESQDE